MLRDPLADGFGEAGLGLAVAGLLLSALVFGILMLGGSRRVVGIVLLVSFVLAWAISVYDATRFAAGNDDASKAANRRVEILLLND